jgi:signal transduction histidine kinase/CheY-like chemotaxis protein
MYKRFQILNVKVIKVGNYGAVVKLPDGSTGVIRPKELSWDGNTENIKIGDFFSAKIMNIKKGGKRINLSKRLAEYDPWKNVYKEYEEGEYIDVKVVDIFDESIRVEIEPAIEGFAEISKDFLERFNAKEITQLFSYGDYTKGIIEEINYKKRYFILSIEKAYEKFRKQIEKEIDKEKSKTNHISEIELIGEKYDKPINLEKNKNIKVLIIDDEPIILDSIAEAIKDLNYEVETSNSGENISTDVDLVFLDINMPGKDGYEVANELIDKGYNPGRIIFVTGAPSRINYEKAISKIKCAGILSKPIDSNRLNEYIQKALKDGVLPRDVNLLERRIEDFRIDDNEEVIKEGIYDLLNEIHEELQVDKSSIFYIPHDIDDIQNVEILYSVNLETNHLKGALNKLRYSPIKDVIKGEEFLEPGLVAFNENKFKNLLEFTKFSDCIGIPIYQYGQCEHGLFLFKDEISFKKEDFRYAKIFSRLIGKEFEKKKKMNIIKDQHPYVNLGYILATIEHEFNNNLTYIKNINKKIEKLIEDISFTKEIKQIKRSIEPERYIERVRKMIDIFSKYAEEAEKQHINKIIDENIPHININELNRYFSSFYLNDKEGFMNLLKNRKFAAKIKTKNIRHYLYELKKTTTDMKTIIKNFTVRKDESKKEIEVNSLLKNIKNKLRFELQEKDINCIIELDEKLPKIITKILPLEQIIFNIMLNAIQHLQKCNIDKKIIKLKTNYIKGKNRPVIIEIIDYGFGVNRRNWDKVFSPGYSSRNEGSGMGLHICRDFAKTINAKIKIEKSLILFGSTFKIELPLKMEEN